MGLRHSAADVAIPFQPKFRTEVVDEDHKSLEKSENVDSNNANDNASNLGNQNEGRSADPV